MIKALLLSCCFVLGCKNSGGDGLDKCAVSVGSCDQGAQSCGVQFGCENSKRLELKCTPPAAGAKTIDCQCVDNGVLGKTVQIVYPMSGDARAVGSSACGWAR